MFRLRPECKSSKDMDSFNENHPVFGVLRILAQALMELQTRAIIRANRYERCDTRRMYRNGYRESVWSTSLGNIPICVPKLRSGSYKPQFLRKPQAEELLIWLAARAYFGLLTLDDVTVALTDLGFHRAHKSEAADILERIFDFLGDEKVGGDWRSEDAVAYSHLDRFLCDWRRSEQGIPVTTLISIIEAAQEPASLRFVVERFRACAHRVSCPRPRYQLAA